MGYSLYMSGTNDPRFLLAYGFTHKWEKGNVDDPADAGGRTSDGITQAVYNAYRAKLNKPLIDVYLATSEEKRDIYFRIWVSSRAAYVANQYLATVMFDTAVNFGVGRLNEFIRIAISAESGRTWPTEASSWVHDPVKSDVIASRIVALRMEFRGRRILDKPNQVKFLRGWLNRDRDLLELGLRLSKPKA